MAEVDPAPLVDANLVLWAHHAQFLQHEPARRWWAATLTEAAQVAIFVAHRLLAFA